MGTHFIIQIIFTAINISIATAFVVSSFRYYHLRKFLLEINDRCYDKVKEYHSKSAEAVKRSNYDEFEALTKEYHKVLSAWNRVIIYVYSINKFSALTSLMKPIKYESWFPKDVVEVLKGLEEEVKSNKITKG
jgi:hypothetical protein